MSTDSAAGEELVELEGSHRNRLDITGTLVDAPADDVVTVTVVLRRRNELPEEIVHGQERVSREEFASRYGADPADIEGMQEFAQSRDLRVVDIDAASRRVRIEGSVAALQRAFGVRLQAVEGGTLRIREGPIMIPASLQGVIVGVFGLDNRPQARPHLITRAGRAAGQTGITPADYTATNLATLYRFPSNVNGSGQTIGILEFGGGYRQSDLNSYFSSLSLAAPAVTSVSVDKATNNPGQDTNADQEVALDIEVAGGCAPGAKIAVYFAPNSDQGFLDAASAAVHDQTNNPTTISISWGKAEGDWTTQAMQTMDGTFSDAAALGICVFAAAGDQGSSDGMSDGLVHVDFPASSPHVSGCGGTHLNSWGNNITSEIVWNSSGAATGGGVSAQFAVPTWQQNAGVPASVNPGHATGRGVPDVAGAADTSPGFRIYVNGGFTTVGGTSGVAPMWAALTARLNQALGHNLGGLNPLIYGRQAGLGGFHDITSGNNGAYSAGPWWDACTGYGSPEGDDLLAALRGPYPMIWRLVGNTAGFGQVWDGRPFWTGDFSGVGHAQVMFYYPGDSNWWLGTVGGGQLGWQLVGNTSGFGNISGDRFWTGDLSGVGHAQVMFYYPGNGNWWLGTVAAGHLTWQLVGNTSGFGNISGDPFWTGDFSGTGHAQVMFNYPGDGNWWLGTVAAGHQTWQLVSNTAGFGKVAASCPFWTGTFLGPGHAQIMFYYPGDKNWWLGNL
jgi:kumamolisin